MSIFNVRGITYDFECNHCEYGWSEHRDGLSVLEELDGKKCPKCGGHARNTGAMKD